MNYLSQLQGIRQISYVHRSMDLFGNYDFISTRQLSCLPCAWLLEGHKVETEAASCHLPHPHVQMEPNSCFPPANQLCPCFLLQCQVLNIQIPCHLVREQSSEFGGRVGLVQTWFSEPVKCKEVFVLRKLFSKSFP